MVIAGIDPSKTKLAIAILDGSELTIHTFTTKAVARGDQLAELAQAATDLTRDIDAAYIEEPLIGRSVRSSLHVAMTAGAIGAAVHAPCYFVPVTTWKKGTVGSGNANKAGVSAWLNATHVAYSQQCGSDQDLRDATTIALYGRSVQELAASFSHH